MAWKTDHNDLTTRTWVCVNCGCTCLSKSPWQRNTHGEGPGGLLNTMYLQHMRNISLAKMVPAYPARPKEEPQVYWTAQGGGIVERNSAFCMIGNEQDIAIMISPGNDYMGDTGKPLKTSAARLLEFFKLIREVDQSVLDGYACAELGGGHKWTDDPEQIEAWRAKRSAPADEED